ncbi:GspL/Epsl periplasmic domain-containing protein (plasmid) [Escherichia coli]
MFLAGSNAGLAHYRLWQQAEFWQHESVRVYQELFPGETVVKDPHRQMLNICNSRRVTICRNVGGVMHQLQQLLPETSTSTLTGTRLDSSSQTLERHIAGSLFSGSGTLSAERCEKNISSSLARYGSSRTGWKVV